MHWLTPFFMGYRKEIRDKLLTRKLPEDLDQIITLAIGIEARLEDRRHMAKEWSPTRFVPIRCRPSPTLPHQPPTPTPPKVDSKTESEVMMVRLLQAVDGGEKLMNENSGIPVLRRIGTLCLDLSGKRGTPTSGMKSSSGRNSNQILYL